MVRAEARCRLMAGITPDVLVFFLTSSVLLSFLAMMLGAWIWALVRIWRGIPLLAGVTPCDLRQARWGALTVLAVIVVYLGVNAAVFRLYERATGRQMPHAEAHVDPGEGAGKRRKAAQENPAEGPPGAPGIVPAEQSQGELMLQLAVINTVLILLLPAVLRLTSDARFADLGFDLNDGKQQVIWGVGAAMLMIPAVIAIQSLAVRVWSSQRHPVELMVLEQFTPGVALLALVSTVVLAPVIEEMLFRAIIQRWLCRLFGERSAPPVIAYEDTPPFVDDLTGSWSSDEPGEKQKTAVDWSDLELDDASMTDRGSAGSSSLAIVITSLFFAALHLPQWPAPIAIFLLSLGLGSLYQKTGSLLAVIAMHGTFNGFSTVLMLLEAIDHQLQPHVAAAPQALGNLGGLLDLAGRVGAWLM
jgi:membrane protease YdiL (CAAX protease family)